MKLVRQTSELLRAKLNIPKSYSTFFVSSATECWEIIAQSLVDHNSFHLHNGAFGEKWYHYTKRLKPNADELPFDRETLPDLARLKIPSNALICLTHNETSNGTSLPLGFMRNLRKHFPSHLIAVDATSSMAGVSLDFKTADVWFASVQKCFGLPAGLAVLICSPAALDRARSVGEQLHYNSLVFLEQMMAKWQTTYTPNVLGIYLLNRSLERRRAIKEIDKETTLRSASWYEFLEARRRFKALIANPNVRSKTVIAVSSDTQWIEKAKQVSKRSGYLLGNGYAQLAQTTFRIANFPALTNPEIKGLRHLLKNY